MQKTKKNIVSITVTPQSITCAWISPTNYFPFTLHAVHTHPLHDISHDSLQLFNITQLHNIITAFIITHAIKKPHLAIALTGTPLQESITSTDYSANITKQNGYIWQSCSLFPLASGDTAQYICGIPASILLQYQLLATRIKCPLLRVTTDTHALITLYRAIHGVAYRASKLADHLHAQKNNLYNLFSKETVARILKSSIDSSFSLIDNAPALLAASGLTLLENKNYE